MFIEPYIELYATDSKRGREGLEEEQKSEQAAQIGAFSHISKKLKKLLACEHGGKVLCVIDQRL